MPPGSLELTLEPGLTDDVLERLHDLELTVGLGLADEDVLGDVHVLLRRDLAARAVEREAALIGSANLVHVEGTGLLDGGFPEVNTDVAEDHRGAGDAVFLHEARRVALLEPSLEVG